jgi:hypothetical protein
LNKAKLHPIINAQRGATWHHGVQAARTPPVTNIGSHNVNEFTCKEEIGNIHDKDQEQAVSVDLG